jgi:hypothetical protein
MIVSGTIIRPNSVRDFAEVLISQFYEAPTEAILLMDFSLVPQRIGNPLRRIRILWRKDTAGPAPLDNRIAGP